MKIQSLEVSNYKRLSLNPNMSNIKFVPKKRIALILGDNGSGKSSFLDLLCPRVIPSKDFNTDGFVKLSFSLNDTDYRLETIDGRYKFYEEGVNLNVSGGIKQQQGLLEHLINIPPSIQGILTGATVFTALPVSARRDIMETLSGSDYTYITHVYKSTQARLRDSKAVIEYAQRQLITQESELETLIRLSSDADGDIEILEKEIRQLLTECNNDIEVVSRDVVRDKLNTLNSLHGNLISTHKRLLKKTAQSLTVSNYYSVDNIHDVLSKRYFKLLGKKDALSGQHHKLDLELSEGDDNIVPIDDLKVALGTIDAKLNTPRFKSVSRERYAYSNPKVNAGAIRLMVGVLGTLNDIDQDDYEKYMGGYTSEAKISDLSKEYRDLRANALEGDNNITEYKQLKIDEINCPKCKYKWSEGFEESVLIEKEKLHANIVAEMNSLKEELSEKESYWGRVAIFDEAYKQYKAYGPPITDTVRPLLNEINNRMKRSCKGINKIVQRHLEAIDILVEYDEETCNKDIILKQIKDYSGVSERVTDVKRAELARLANEMKICTMSGQILSGRIKEVSSIIMLRDKVNDLLKESVGVRLEWDNAVANYSATIKDAVIRDLVDRKHIEVNRLRVIHTSKIKYQNKIEELKADIVSKTDEFNTNKTLMGVTNPKGKLVAQSMLGFLNAFIEDMNVILAKVWSYPLEILPFEGDLESLNYRFKFKAGTSTRDDMSQASKATSDIINIAFKLVAMTALNLDDFPVYLDELGEGYDDEHRINLCTVVDEYLTTKSYSNIFLVAQVREIYDYFDGASSEKVLLSTSNIHIDTEQSSIVTLK